MKIGINQEHIIGILCIALGIVIFSLTSQFPAGQAIIDVSGPAFFPNVIAVIFIITGVIELVIGFFFTKHHNFELKNIWQQIKRPGFINIIIIISVFILYIIFVSVLGFISSTLIFLFIVMWRLKVPVWKNIIYSAVLTGTIIIIFVKLFTVTLPSGILF